MLPRRPAAVGSSGGALELPKGAEHHVRPLGEREVAGVGDHGLGEPGQEREKAAPSAAPTKTSRAPRTARTGARTPRQVAGPAVADARAARRNAAGRTASPNARSTSGSTERGRAKRGTARRPSSPIRPSARSRGRPPPGSAASARMASSMPANHGSRAPPRSGERIASSTAGPVGEISSTPVVATGSRAARASATIPPSE